MEPTTVDFTGKSFSEKNKIIVESILKATNLMIFQQEH